MDFPNWPQEGSFRSEICAALCICAALLGSGLHPETVRSADTRSFGSKVRRTWKEREQRIKSVDCECSADVTHPAKSCPYYYDIPGKPLAIPLEDLTVKNNFRFRLVGDQKMRMEFNGLQPIEETRDFQPRSFVTTSDGQEQRSYFGKDEAASEPRYAPVGSIYKETRLWAAGLGSFKPLLILFRPSCPEVMRELDLARFLVKPSINIAGKQCGLLESSDTLNKIELVVDMDRDCVPLRVRGLNRKSSKADGAWWTSWLVEMTYEDSPEGAWKLTGWKSGIFRETGAVIDHAKFAVTKCDLNVAISDDVFRFEFPVGTLVQDFKKGENFIVREGGKKRRVTQAERDAMVPYKNLLTTEPPRELLSPGFLITVFAGTLVVVSIGYRISKHVMAKRKKGEATNPPTP